ncbi:S-protein homolog 8 [Eutrema salsugineum]|nr:S-protein homolog 8 [Eutrema salsugineum]
MRLTVILMVVCLYCTEQAEGGSVFIYNNLRHGKFLKVHCKSGDNDWGWHVRKYDGLYHFSFKDHILDKTLIWCHLWRGRNFKITQTFVAYESKKYKSRHTWMRWSARESGIYESIGGKPFQFRYNWGDKL